MLSAQQFGDKRVEGGDAGGIEPAVTNCIAAAQLNQASQCRIGDLR
jgi:hypothetical protein